MDCLVLKTLEFTTDITMVFGSRESLEIGNQGIDQAPRNIPWFLEAIPKEDVSWAILPNPIMGGAVHLHVLMRSYVRANKNL